MSFSVRILTRKGGFSRRYQAHQPGLSTLGEPGTQARWLGQGSQPTTVSA